MLNEYDSTLSTFCVKLMHKPLLLFKNSKSNISRGSASVAVKETNFE